MLRKCLQCGGKVSTQAFSCPHCGKLSPTNGKLNLAIPPDTRILRSDPQAAEKWEEIRLKIREAEAAYRAEHDVLKAVVREGARQAEMLDLIRDRAWQVFSAAGCPKCRAHAVRAMNPRTRVRFLSRGRLIAAMFRGRYCHACGHAW